MQIKSHSKYLRSVAKYLEQYGWIQGEMGEHLGPRCMTGAMKSVAGEACPFPLELHEVVGRSIVDFNDTCCESVYDATAALEIAADIAEANEKMLENDRGLSDH